MSTQQHSKPMTWMMVGAMAMAMAMAMAGMTASGVTLAAETAALPAGMQQFDAQMERVRKQFDVPGIAVAIVKDGQIVLERGYGVRELGKPAPVQADTLFAIASNTKAFTAASLSILADEGKLSLDDRVIEHLPWFRMSNPYVTNEMRVRDLLAHRSGLSLGAGDLLYWPTTGYSNKEVAQRLKDNSLTYLDHGSLGALVRISPL